MRINKTADSSHRLRLPWLVTAVVVVLLHGLFLLWKPYQKHLFWGGASPYPLSDILSGIYYYAIFFITLYFLVCFFCLNGIVVMPLDAKRKVQLGLRCVGIRLAVDSIKLMTQDLPDCPFLLLQGLLESMFTLSCCLLLLQALHPVSRNQIKLFFKSRAGLLHSILFITSFFLFGLFVIKSDLHLQMMQTKYDASSAAIQELVTAHHFWGQLKLLFLDCMSTIIFLSALAYLVGPENRKPSAKQKKSISAIRVFSAMIGALFLCNLEALFAPQESFSVIGQHSSSWHAVASTVFHSQEDTFEISLVGADRNEQEIAYSDISKTIYYQNKKILFCHSDMRPEPSDHYGANFSASVGATDVYLSGTQAFLFLDSQQQPRAYLCKNLAKTGKDDELTQVLQGLIAQGFLEIYMDAVPYLQKYAPEFAAEYTMRYAKGEFTEAERTANPDLKLEYVIAFAQKQPKKEV